jgi:DNA-binding beta-propeller fold protein YncE
VIYTSELRNQRVQKFTTEGKFLGTFPLQTNPGGLAVDPKGNVYVGFWNANKVAAYSPEGKLLREWGKKGTGDGEFQLPGSVAFGPDGLLYVPDQGNSRVQKFTPDGKKGTWTGTVERTRQGAPRLPVENVRYRLKPAKEAGKDVAELLAKIGKGEATGEYAVTGTVELTDYAWILVERIEAKK